MFEKWRANLKKDMPVRVVRTAGAIGYSLDKIEDTSNINENLKYVKFDFGEQGVAVNLIVEVEPNDSADDIIKKSMRELLNFKSLKICDLEKQ